LGPVRVWRGLSDEAQASRNSRACGKNARAVDARSIARNAAKGNLKMQTVRDAALGPAPEGADNLQLGFQTIWRQACEGLDVDRLLPSREKRARDLAKKLDRSLERNGWRIFVSGQAYAMKHGKARQQRNAEVMLVETVARWRK